MCQCPICFDHITVPVYPLHDINPKTVDAPVCRQEFCEQCLIRCSKCPMCNLRLSDAKYTIRSWRLFELDEMCGPVQCHVCDWTGSRLDYMIQHSHLAGQT